MGSRLNVQFARGGRERREPFFPDRPAPRTRRTLYRLNVTGLQGETSWQVRSQYSEDVEAELNIKHGIQSQHITQRSHVSLQSLTA
jgi:hypothetical protein